MSTADTRTRPGPLDEQRMRVWRCVAATTLRSSPELPEYCTAWAAGEPFMVIAETHAQALEAAGALATGPVLSCTPVEMPAPGSRRAAFWTPTAALAAGGAE